MRSGEKEHVSVKNESVSFGCGVAVFLSIIIAIWSPTIVESRAEERGAQERPA